MNEEQELTFEDVQQAAREALGLMDDMNQFTERFLRFWELLLGEPLPSAHQVVVWYKLHSDNLLRLIEALNKTAAKAEQMENENKKMSFDHAVRFLSSTANYIKTRDQENGNE